ncbi:MAG: FAD-dependent oxidoreductase, partial [Sphingomonadaceae bacterium]
MSKPAISILGAGFAALTAAQTLRKQLPEAKITLIAPRSQFEYFPSLIWVPTGLRQRKDILHSLDGFFQRHDITFKQASVTGLSAGGRTVETSDGSVTNDALVIATGGRFIKKMPGIEHALTICEGIDAAEAIG